MNTWQQLVKEFQLLKERVDALEAKQHVPLFVKSPVLEVPQELENVVRRGRPRKSVEGEDVI